MNTLFVLIPAKAEFEDVYDAIKEAAVRSTRFVSSDIEVQRPDDLEEDTVIIKSIMEAMNRSDVIIADVTAGHPNILFQLGLARALDKPVILISQTDPLQRSNLGHLYTFHYDRNRLSHHLVPHLADAITSALQNPDRFRGTPGPVGIRPKAFVSYSHADTAAMERMMIHLRPLVNQGLIDIWSDQEIKVGDNWRRKIEQALSEAAIAVLLISADFLASEFIVENELPPLLAAAETDGTRILPVILKPCRFAREEGLAKYQALNDPAETLFELAPVQQERVWDKLAQAIEAELESS